MANEDFITNIPENFDLTVLADTLTQQYQMKGYVVRTVNMGGSVQIIFDKKTGGINNLLGMGEGITATCSIQGKNQEMLSVNFSNADWTGKIVGLVVGWFLCLVPFITAIIGTTRQLALPKDIANSIRIAANSQ